MYAGAIVGEICYFLNTPRTATVVNVDNNRVFYLAKELDVMLARNCPQIRRNLHKQIYGYSDQSLTTRVKLLRGSIFYFKQVEIEALIELAFQIQPHIVQANETVIAKFQKIE